MVGVNKKFAFLPGIIWALALDTVDVLGFVKTLVATLLVPVLGPLGLAVDIVLDGIIDLAQGLVALFVFSNPKMWQVGTSIDLIAVPGFDLLPSYTLTALAIDLKLLR